MQCVWDKALSRTVVLGGKPSCLVNTWPFYRERKLSPGSGAKRMLLNGTSSMVAFKAWVAFHPVSFGSAFVSQVRVLGTCLRSAFETKPQECFSSEFRQPLARQG